MRVADKMALNQVTGSLQKNRAELSDLQNQAATQKRVNKPSDDPGAAARVLAARTEERGSQQFMKNINIARSFLEFTDQSLGELSETLMRAKELAIAQSTDSGANAQTRRLASAEIEQMYKQSVQIANRKFGDRYIFGGFQTKQAPFNPQGDYQGDDGDIKIQIHKDAFLAMNVPGDKVFLGKGVGNDGVIRPTDETPISTPDLQKFKAEEDERVEKNREQEQAPVQARGLASVGGRQPVYVSDAQGDVAGINVFKTIKDLEIALKTDDKETIQESLDSLDQAIQQVVMARSQVGARVGILNSTTDSLQKSVLDNRQVASQLEDADTFQLVSDINKTDAALKATLETSGKLIQPSLLDFLK